MPEVTTIAEGVMQANGSCRLLLLFALISVLAGPVFAADAGAIDSGDTAWILMSSALVLLMTLPGLALFYAGLVRHKNVLGTIMHSAIILCAISVLWIFIGYSLAFGPDHWGFIGGIEWAGLHDVGLEPNADYAPTIPHQLFMVFQLMFAAITPALITGAFAERIKFKALLLFSVLWSLLIYCPLAHWVWGAGGWLHTRGALDFAGGAVVHISAGAAALACALCFGKRKGYGDPSHLPHNIPMVVMGAGLLWFGWFGFNAGSALGANKVAVVAFVATHAAGAAAGMMWMTIEWLHKGKPSVLGVAIGVVAGLATVTPASGFITPMAALAIGAMAGVFCYGGCMVRMKFAYDDTLDVAGVHGVGGIVGVLAVGLFASIGATGWFMGNAHQMEVQALTAVVAAGFCFAGTFVLLKMVQALVGLRVTDDHEEIGLDMSQHGEKAYAAEHKI